MSPGSRSLLRATDLHDLADDVGRLRDGAHTRESQDACGWALAKPSTEDAATLGDILRFAAGCLTAVAEAASGMHWHSDREVADTVNPYLLAAEAARQAVDSAVAVIEETAR